MAVSRTPAVLVCILLLASATLQPSPGVAASRFGPPTEMMLDRYNKVAVAVAREGPDNRRIRFERVETIFGDVPQEWEARVGMDDLSDIEWGGEYLVAFTEVRRNPLDRETRELDPDGPRIVGRRVVQSLHRVVVLRNAPVGVHAEVGSHNSTVRGSPRVHAGAARVSLRTRRMR